MRNFDWRTEMRRDDDREARSADRLRGQAAMTILDGDRVQLHTIPDVGCFGSDAIISMDDARRLANAILLHTPRYPEGTPEHATYVAELSAELWKFAARKAPHDGRG